MNISAGELSAILNERITNYGKEASTSIDEVGKVFSVGDGIARIYGLDKVKRVKWLSLVKDYREWP